MIADNLLGRFPQMDNNGFCVGNIAPDCNVENEDWTAFTPPREVTHWMGGARKSEADCERFWEYMIEGRMFGSEEQRSFFLGYYAHLVTDALFQKFTRDEARVRNMLARIMARPEMAARMDGLPMDYDSVKRAFSKRERLEDVERMEYEYLCKHPQSGYRTVLQTLREFSDYVDYLPKGAIVRKICVMAVDPEPAEDARFVFFTRDEYAEYVKMCCEAVAARLCPEGSAGL